MIFYVIKYQDCNGLALEIKPTSSTIKYSDINKAFRSAEDYNSLVISGSCKCIARKVIHDPLGQ